ncbi:hypothetical protein HMPREF1430_00995 [Helicobacter pylori GAM96Ai]|uniref:type I restriction endonuclease subunit R, EcoR124 family n=1 Tax=Helicobacter pylori TaxID=210 RepID=UPI0002BC3CCE|nr:hypothetical protein [Helicobacter pylori]EMH42072.1 hypothetical protein HMPREF1430_00995 [Helicobacter pylori GAM96Ai]
MKEVKEQAWKEEFQKICEQHDLKQAEANEYVKCAFRDGEIKFYGIDFPRIINNLGSRFGKGGNYQKRKKEVAAVLSDFFNRYHS